MAIDIPSEDRRPKALFITPTVPAPGGNGLAMRASVTAEALSRIYDLSTAIVPVSSPKVDRQNLAWIKAHSIRVAVVPLPTKSEAAQGWLGSGRGREIVSKAEPLPARARLASPGLGDLAPGPLAGDHYDIVWVMRLYLVGTVLPFLEQEPRPRLVLDADEDDSATLLSIARLDHIRSATEKAAALREEADAFARLGRATLGLFDQIAVASEAECVGFRQTYGLANVTTLPNAIRLEGGDHPPSKPATETGPVELLFVGNMDYAPNRDAVNRLAANIFPMVRDKYGDAVLHIIGGGGVPLPGPGGGVRYHGQVETLKPFYDRARVAICPLSAGGGSRIKLLEAFAKGLPVVATQEAAAGLDVTDGEQLLIGRTNADLADGVIRLIEDRNLASNIANRARNFVSSHHDAEEIMDLISATARGTK